MRVLRHVLARLRALARRNVVADEIREEMLFHLQMRAEQYRRQGLGPDEARRSASRRFGSLALMQDRGYDVRGGGLLETVLLDVRYALRFLTRDRAFSVVAVLTLAVGIGVSTALFSLIDAALLRPLPYPQPERLVDVSDPRESERQVAAGSAPSLADIRAWRESGRVFAHVGAGRLTGFQPKVVDAGQAERLVVGETSEDFLEVFDVRPLLGRAIRIDDTREDSPGVALLGHGYWQSRFGGVPDVLGRVIRIEGAPATIVGVLPAGFYDETAVWEPTRRPASRVGKRGSGAAVCGRLRPGVTLAQAERALTKLTLENDTEREGATVVRVELRSMYDSETRGLGTAITSLACAVGLILLIACVNVAGLLLARGAVRVPELAIRASIGAGPGRLVRQLLTESLVLALAAGALGVVLARISLDGLVAIIPMSLPANSPPTVNLPVLGSAALLSVACAVACGLVPALKLSRARAGAQLTVAGRLQGRPLSRRPGQLLIAAQVALATVLLAGAGLMVRSLVRLAVVDVGFDPSAVLTMEVEPVDPAPGVRQQYYPALLDALRAMPEIATAGAVDHLPMRTDAVSISFVSGAGSTNFMTTKVLPGYFEAMGLRLKRGRFPTESDRAGAEPIALISEKTAQLLFPGESPVGQFLQLVRQQPRRIIGVVGDVRQGGPLWASWPELYPLYDQAAQQSPENRPSAPTVSGAVGRSPPPGGGGCRPEGAGRAHQVCQRGSARQCGDPAPPDLALRSARRSGSPAHAGGHLRHDGLCRRTTHAGDRRSNGVRRARRRRRAAHGPGGRVARVGRTSGRNARRVPGDEGRQELPVRHHAARPGNVRGRCPADDRSGAGRGLDARPPRGACRSRRGAPRRVTRFRWGQVLHLSILRDLTSRRRCHTRIVLRCKT